jgi:hypothetical protein
MVLKDLGSKFLEEQQNQGAFEAAREDIVTLLADPPRLRSEFRTLDHNGIGRVGLSDAERWAVSRHPVLWNKPVCLFVCFFLARK